MKGTVAVLIVLLGLSAVLPLAASAQGPFDAITVGYLPSGPTYDPGNGYIYVVNCCQGNPGGDTVSVISGTNVVATIPNIEVSNTGLGLTLAGDDLYVPVGTGVVGISGEGIMANLTSLTCGGSGTLGYDNSTGVLFYVCGNDGTLIQSKTASIVQNDENFTQSCGENCNIPADLSNPVFDPSNGDMYISSAAYNQTDVTSEGPGTLVNVGAFPSTPGVDPSTGDVYVPNQGCEYGSSVSCSISVISGISVIGTIPMSAEPGTPVFDPANGYMYVPGACANTPATCWMAVIDGTNLLMTIPDVFSAQCGGQSQGICTPLVYDSSNGYMVINDGNHVEWISGTSTLGLATPVPNGYSNAAYTPALDPQTNVLYESGTYDDVYAMSVPQLIASNEANTTTQISSAAQSTSSTPSVSASSTMSSTSSGGIPVFPYQGGLVGVLLVVVIASYLLIRRGAARRAQTTKGEPSARVRGYS